MAFVMHFTRALFCRSGLATPTSVQLILPAFLVGTMNTVLCAINLPLHFCWLDGKYVQWVYEGQREARQVPLTRHAMRFYLCSKSADKLHHMPADKKEPGHFSCKAETHPCLGTLVTDSQHLPCITSANSTQRNYRL